MDQLDWVGGKTARRVFKDIGNQRPSTAQEKAELCAKLADACRVIPAYIRAGADVVQVRQWKADLDAAMKVVGRKTSSIPELQYELRKMQAWADKK